MIYPALGLVFLLSLMVLAWVVILYWPAVEATPSASTQKVYVVGGGLAGCTTALALANKGHQVVLLEKASALGGNSVKASSGINGAHSTWQKTLGIEDSSELFHIDTLKYSQKQENPLSQHLAEQSVEALQWLAEQGVTFNQVVKLGGHSTARTHRSTEYMSIGSAIMGQIMPSVEHHDNIQVQLDTEVQDVMIRNLEVTGLQTAQGQVETTQVVLTQGGFAADKAWLQELRPDLARWGTTSGPQANGTLLRSLQNKCLMLDLASIQVHPTGFVDPKDPDNPNKVLAAEILRGVGGQLLNHRGERFCDELGSRQEVYEAMLAQEQEHFTLRVPQESYQAAKQHVDYYLMKGLLRETAQGYEGIVTPVVHYCHGGLHIDEKARVKNPSGELVKGLWAAGESTGGLHGANRLGGNSLLECVVFGLTIAEQFPTLSDQNTSKVRAPQRQTKAFTLTEVARHKTEEDCYVVIAGEVYEIPPTVIKQHPNPEQWVQDYAGKDVSQEFQLMHHPGLLKLVIHKGKLQ